MLNFTQIAFLDPYELACSLRPRLALFGEADENGRRSMPIRWQGDEGRWLRPKEVAKWPELNNTLSRIEQIGMTIVGPVERGRISFEMLDPGAALPWRRETDPYFAEYWRVHMAIRTNPGCILYAGAESVNLWPGQIVRVGQSTPQSAQNLGDWPRIHLVADFRLTQEQKAENE